MRLKWLVAVALICGIPAFAGPILLNNTGVGGTVGNPDTNWFIFGSGTAYVTTGSAGSFPFSFDANPMWLANDSTSQWISPQPTYVANDPGDPTGGWPFSVTFDLTGMDPATAVITGRWLADNQGYDIWINGVPTGQTTGANAWQAWSGFTVDSGFQSGLNTLEFYVSNSSGAVGNPVGLRAEFLGATADELVPEPATFVLMGAGLLGLGLLRRRKA